MMIVTLHLLKKSKNHSCLQLKILDDSSQEEQSEAEQSQPGEKIAQSNRHSKKAQEGYVVQETSKINTVNQ